MLLVQINKQQLIKFSVSFKLNFGPQTGKINEMEKLELVHGIFFNRISKGQVLVGTYICISFSAVSEVTGNRRFPLSNNLSQ